jgi:hypothetical protein
MGLDAYLVEWLTESANCKVRILTSHQVYLLKGSTVGFYSGETAHIDDSRGNAFQLVFTRLKLARTLPHVSVNETKLDLFLCHISSYY